VWVPCSIHRGTENCVQNLVGNCEGKSLLGKSAYTWKNNIKIDFKEMGWKGVYWTLWLCI
jgi:hypothetical protein